MHALKDVSLFTMLCLLYYGWFFSMSGKFKLFIHAFKIDLLERHTLLFSVWREKKKVKLVIDMPLVNLLPKRETEALVRLDCGVCT